MCPSRLLALSTRRRSLISSWTFTTRPSATRTWTASTVSTALRRTMQTAWTLKPARQRVRARPPVHSRGSSRPVDIFPLSVRQHLTGELHEQEWDGLISRHESGRHFGSDFELGRSQEKCSVVRQVRYTKLNTYWSLNHQDLVFLLW